MDREVRMVNAAEAESKPLASGAALWRLNQAWLAFGGAGRKAASAGDA